MIRLFIGTEDAQWLPTEVLKHSVLRRTKEPVEFTELKNLPIKIDRGMYTGFSFYRYSIPEACNYQGRAIYLDADIIVLADIKELNDIDLGDKNVLARPNNEGLRFTSVMPMDCSKLKHWKVQSWIALINAGMADYQATMAASKKGLNFKDFGDLPTYWNDLDYADEHTKILHYTHVPTQPWKKPGHPHRNLFLKEMHSAMKAGLITEADVQREIAGGHVYATILEDIYRIQLKSWEFDKEAP